MGSSSTELTFYTVIAAYCLGLILKFSILTMFLSQDQNFYTKFLS